MKTSNFSKSSDLPNVISIASKDPNWYYGDRYPDLAPPMDLIGRYKRGEINDEEYTKEYASRVLNKLNAQDVYDELEDKVLLCWCAKGKFCHRRLVAKWIESEIGIKVEEL